MQPFSPAEINVIAGKGNLPNLSKINSWMCMCFCLSVCPTVSSCGCFEASHPPSVQSEWTGHFLWQTNCPLLNYNSQARVWLMLWKESNLHFPPPFFFFFALWSSEFAARVSHIQHPRPRTLSERGRSIRHRRHLCAEHVRSCVFVIVRVRRRWWSEVSLFAVLIQSSREWADVTPAQGQW